ncbi:hypothetical protein ACIQAC_02260 [Streptomyces sp. NPDC088387]|uniref:hypothetical protein n=1 Tax=Streptomyces sp. NPDC088387 TaxID=3365859 RepID=UPI00381877B0
MSAETPTLDNLVAPLRALRLLAADFGHLPAPTVSLSPIFPNRLQLSLHEGLMEFEEWREALGVAPDAVTYREQSGGRTRVLRASASYGGADLELIGYGDVCTPVLVGGAA